MTCRTMATDDPRREQLIQTVQSRLLRHSLPRFQMFILVALTGAAGFLSAYALLRLGVESMALRYPIAVAIAYGVFLLLLRVWLAIQQRGWGTLADAADCLDLADLVPHGSGGASPCTGASMPKSGGGKSSGFDFVSLDLDEGGILLLAATLVLAMAALGTAFWIVWMAPALLAEVLVDGLVMVAVYRRLRRSGGGPVLALRSRAPDVGLRRRRGPPLSLRRRAAAPGRPRGTLHRGCLEDRKGREPGSSGRPAVILPV